MSDLVNSVAGAGYNAKTQAGKNYKLFLHLKRC